MTDTRSYPDISGLPADEGALANFIYSVRSFDEAEAKAKLLWPLLAHDQAYYCETCQGDGKYDRRMCGLPPEADDTCIDCNGTGIAPQPVTVAQGSPSCGEAIDHIGKRLADLAEANALYGKDQRLGTPDKIARNDREISWLKDLRSIILMPSHIEKTEAGIIDWKMEAERANRLLADAQKIIAEYKAGTTAGAKADVAAHGLPGARGQAVQVPEGFVLVPIEPTSMMAMRGSQVANIFEENDYFGDYIDGPELPKALAPEHRFDDDERPWMLAAAAYRGCVAGYLETLSRLAKDPKDVVAFGWNKPFRRSPLLPSTHQHPMHPEQQRIADDLNKRQAVSPADGGHAA